MFHCEDMGKARVITLGLLALLSGCLDRAFAVPQDGWELIVQNAGVSAMHATLTHTNKVIIFDRTDYGPSQIKLPNGRCRRDPTDLALKVDCTAHSVELDLANNKVRPLNVLTDTWCSSGSFKADGLLFQTGGWNDGGSVVRTIGAGPADDWKEYPNSLVQARWYATNQILPDNRVIIIGGRRAFTYEFQPRGRREGAYTLPFLQNTNDAGAENNLYPFVYLSTDSNLFIFANKDSILLNYKTGKVVKTYPTLPGGPRSYPSSGSSVLLPLSAADGYKAAEVMVCGGAPAGSFQNVGKGKFAPALQSCGRLVITAAAPRWAIENMPMPRVMGDMVILPTGEVLIINGARLGTAGWGVARDPVLTPVLYNPQSRRFQVTTATTIPRLYHSTAIVLPDGRVFVGGSNPQVGYVFGGVDNPTELRIEKYSPYYLNKAYNFRRAQITGSPEVVKYGAAFVVNFTVPMRPTGVLFRLYAPSFTTHTNSMNQRSLIMNAGAIVPLRRGYRAIVFAPPSAVIAPSGYYLLTMTHQGTPSTSNWVHVG